MSGHRQHLGKRRLVPVNDDVDLVGGQHPQVHAAANRLGNAEENVGDRGRDGRPYPAIGQAAIQSAHDQVPVVVVHPHVRAMHEFHNCGVDPGAQCRAFSTAPGAFPERAARSVGFLRQGKLRHEEVGQIAAIAEILAAFDWRFRRSARPRASGPASVIL